MKKNLILLCMAVVLGSGVTLADQNDEKPAEKPPSAESVPKELLEAAQRQAAQSGSGKFSTCTSNPFALCSAPRPDKKNPLRACWDSLC